MWFSLYLSCLELYKLFNLLTQIFLIKFRQFLAFISSSIFFLTIFSSLSETNYIYITLFHIVPHVIEVLFIYFSSLFLIICLSSLTSLQFLRCCYPISGFSILDIIAFIFRIFSCFTFYGLHFFLPRFPICSFIMSLMLLNIFIIAVLSPFISYIWIFSRSFLLTNFFLACGLVFCFFTCLVIFLLYAEHVAYGL